MKVTPLGIIKIKYTYTIIKNNKSGEIIKYYTFLNKNGRFV